MSKVPQKINDILYKFCLMDVDAKRPGGGGKLNAETYGLGGGGGGSKIGKILQTSFMDDSLVF